MKRRLILPAYGRNSLGKYGKVASLPMTFAALFTAVLTLAFSAKRIVSLLLAFTCLKLPFRIQTDWLTFFDPPLLVDFMAPENRCGMVPTTKKSTKSTSVRCSMLSVT